MRTRWTAKRLSCKRQVRPYRSRSGASYPPRHQTPGRPKWPICCSGWQPVSTEPGKLSSWNFTRRSPKIPSVRISRPSNSKVMRWVATHDDASRLRVPLFLAGCAYRTVILPAAVAHSIPSREREHLLELLLWPLLSDLPPFLGSASTPAIVLSRRIYAYGVGLHLVRQPHLQTAHHRFDELDGLVKQVSEDLVLFHDGWNSAGQQPPGTALAQGHNVHASLKAEANYQNGFAERVSRARLSLSLAYLDEVSRPSNVVNEDGTLRITLQDMTDGCCSRSIGSARCKLTIDRSRRAHRLCAWTSNLLHWEAVEPSKVPHDCFRERVH
jgi:hypothetical protein